MKDITGEKLKVLIDRSRKYVEGPRQTGDGFIEELTDALEAVAKMVPCQNIDCLGGKVSGETIESGQCPECKHRWAIDDLIKCPTCKGTRKAFREVV